MARPVINDYRFQVRLLPEQLEFLRDYADQHTKGNVTAALRQVLAVGVDQVQTSSDQHEREVAA